MPTNLKNNSHHRNRTVAPANIAPTTSKAHSPAGRSELRERNASLAAEVIDLKHGLEAVEERARSDMGMIKSDEVFYQIIDSPNTAHRNLLPETPLDEPVVAP